MNARLKMLVVDDDLTFRNRLVAALIARGIDAHGAADARGAITLARSLRPRRAVVDLRMPGESGLDLVRDLIALDGEMGIVLLTGYGSIATATEAVRRGVLEYLTKPADAEQILAAFDRAEGEFRGDIELAPSLARVEWEHIQRVLSDCGGNISHAARVLGIHRRSLQRKLGKLPPG